MNVEEPLTGGAINQVTRRGSVVYRSGGPWVPAIHAVLDHLAVSGFRYSPKALGIDESGREMISFLPGEAMRRPWKPVMFGDAALVQAASMLRDLHAATADLELPSHTVWRTGPAGKVPGMVIRHGDLGPWNTLWQGTTLTGLIDWDFAEPGEALDDLAQLALYFVPLRGEAHWRECGFPERPDFRRRLATLTEAYGSFVSEAVLAAIERLQETEVRRMTEFAEQGLYPWTMFRDNGEIERTQREIAWLREEFRNP